jgi:hypothetical protein
VCVSFSEKGKSAEGYVPSCKIERNNGFTADEVEQMEAYLEENKSLIWEEAKKINITTEAYLIDPLIVTPVVAIPIFLGLLVFLVVKSSKKKRKNSDK